MSWQNLTQQQADLAKTIFPDATKPTLIPLPDQHIITVSGDEAAVFLQNLLTNDVKALNINHAQLTGLCNPKGRLLAIFQLVRREQDFLIVLPAELSAAIAQRLNMFKLRSKVDITVADSLVAVGVINPDKQLTNLPTDTLQGSQTESNLLIKQVGAQPRYLMICEQNAASILADWLISDWQLAPHAYWQLLNIEAGIPTIYNDSKEQFTPQQVNLELVGGVSFKKGCYPGQEVVARLHYLGSPSRRMFLGELNNGQIPATNTPVTDEQGAVSGHVVQAQVNADNRIRCLLSMKLSALETTLNIEGNTITKLIALADDV